MKIGVLMICVNDLFWPYAKEGISTAQEHFFKGHDVEFMLWTDIPKSDSEEGKAALARSRTKADLEILKSQAVTDLEFDAVVKTTATEDIQAAMEYLHSQKDLTLFELDPAPWPWPTLMRYHVFLQQELYLQKFDKLLYYDCDMRVVADVGVDIFGEGLTCAKHPMYALSRSFIPPYEPNPHSAAFIPRFGQIMTDNKSKLWFEPVYAAGGFQGGATKPFIDAMWAMKRSIDRDLQNNYVAIWNDESHWNHFLSQNPSQDLIVLGPDYVYPDSLIKEYYEPIWGRSYTPKVITITKKHSLSRKAGRDLARMSGKTVEEPAQPLVCPTCHDVLMHPAGLQINKIIACRGLGVPHDCELLVSTAAQTQCPTCHDILPTPGITSVTSCGGIGGLHSFTTNV